MVGQSPYLAFRRSLSLTTRAWLAATVAVAMMIADWRLHWLEPLRDGASVLVRPLVALAQWPQVAWQTFDRATRDVLALQQENAALKRQLNEAALALRELEGLRRENRQLRDLLGLNPPPKVRVLPAEVLYDAPDPFSRRLVLDRGAMHGVREGLAVADARGLVAQITRVQPLVSEATLITQRDMRVPVWVEPSGVRGVAVGNGDGTLRLRHVLGRWEVEVGQTVVTSGLDGLYPAGLIVGRVVQVEPGGNEPLVVIEPISQAERVKQVVILERLDRPED